MRTSLALTLLAIIWLFSANTFGQESPRQPPNEPRPRSEQPPQQPPNRGPQPAPQPTPQPNPEDTSEANELALQQIISQQGLLPLVASNYNIPDVASDIAQLGKQLFFTKNLGGEQSVACVSCHHPMLGGGDNLSLSIGINAVDQLNNSAHQLLGVGRHNNDNNGLPVVPRNAPSIFNLALFTRGLFWDSRVERTNNGGIRTPDSTLNTQGRRLPDFSLPADATLAAAQARFPVTSKEEMRGEFSPESTNQTLRTQLNNRFNNSLDEFISTWHIAISNVFNDEEPTFDHLAQAIGEYERSMFFNNSPWNNYLAGNPEALTDNEKAGAILFFTPSQQGGAGCIACHNGDLFSDQRHHLVAFPQIGVGKGNTSETATSHDFGRENITNNASDKFHFRTPSLLNISATAPYGHSGAYQTLEEVVRHYNNPRASINRLFSARGQVPFNGRPAPYCALPQIAAITSKNNQLCETIFPDAYQNSITTINHLELARNNEAEASAPFRARPNLNNEEVQQVVAFLTALSDPCVTDRACMAPWIVDENDEASFPDDQLLIATDAQGNAL